MRCEQLSRDDTEIYNGISFEMMGLFLDRATIVIDNLMTSTDKIDVELIIMYKSKIGKFTSDNILCHSTFVNYEIWKQVIWEYSRHKPGIFADFGIIEFYKSIIQSIVSKRC
jgi:hypothetical protein